MYNSSVYQKRCLAYLFRHTVWLSIHIFCILFTLFFSVFGFFLIKKLYQVQGFSLLFLLLGHLLPALFALVGLPFVADYAKEILGFRFADVEVATVAIQEKKGTRYQAERILTDSQAAKKKKRGRLPVIQGLHIPQKSCSAVLKSGDIVTVVYAKTPILMHNGIENHRALRMRPIYVLYTFTEAEVCTSGFFNSVQGSISYKQFFCTVAAVQILLLLLCRLFYLLLTAL